MPSGNISVGLLLERGETMAKKSFKNINPALQFINVDTLIDKEAIAESVERETEKIEKNAVAIKTNDEPESVRKEAGASGTSTSQSPKTAEKKAEAPSLVPPQLEDTETLNAAPVQESDEKQTEYTHNTYIRAARTVPKEGEERKSKRLNLLLQPSLLDDISKVAHMKRTSVNDLINTVLKEYREREGQTLEDYRNIFGDA